MTNMEIIINEAIANGIFTEEEIQTYLDNGLPIPLHTYRHWQDLGFQVDKGERAALVTKLWKPKQPAKGMADGNAQAIEGENRDGFFLAKAHLFTVHQVSRATPAE